MLKKSSSESEAMHLSDFCVLPGNSSESLQPEFCSVYVKQEDPICHNTVMSSDTQQNSGGTVSQLEELQMKHEQVNFINTLMTDLIEDVSFDHHLDQYDSIVNKVSYDKKNSNIKKKPSHKNITVPNTAGSPQEAFNFHMFDDATAEILKSIVSSNNYYRGNLGNIINKGHNSVVIYAYIYKKDYPRWEPGAKPILMYATINEYGYNKLYWNCRSEENVVKVYKLSEEKSKNERIFKQVQREKEHLHLLRKAKCTVPEIKRCSRNVIVMSLVGTDGVPAQSIETLVTQSLKRFQNMYNTVVKDIEMWYKRLHIIHGNLASKNILYWKKEVHYIGWSHSVKAEHPVALKKLMKDCHFITKFFETRGVPVKSTEKLFQDITGIKDVDASVSVNYCKDLWKSQHLANPNRMPTSHTDNPGRRFKDDV